MGWLSTTAPRAPTTTLPLVMRLEGGVCSVKSYGSAVVPYREKLRHSGLMNTPTTQPPDSISPGTLRWAG